MYYYRHILKENLELLDSQKKPKKYCLFTWKNHKNKLMTAKNFSEDDKKLHTLQRGKFTGDQYFCYARYFGVKFLLR